MNIRKFFMLLLAANLAVAVASDWQTTNKIFVILNAIALLFLIIRKTVTKED